MSSALPSNFTLACPECAQVFTAADAQRIPTGLSCGHVLCAECANAVTIVSLPVCTICKAPIEAAGNELPALAAFCDATEMPVAREVEASTAAALLAKEKLFRDKAAAATNASQSYQQKIAALQESADAAVETVVAATAQLKAKLDEVVAARVARIRSCCAEGLKQLEIEHDELLVRCSQLGAAASLCASALASCEMQAAGVLASLRTFDALASKPIPNAHLTVAVRMDDDIVRRVDEEWMSVVYRRQPGWDVQGKFVQKYTILTSSRNVGIAISPDGSQFAVSNYNSDDITIYAVADVTHIRTFGGEGAEPGKFNNPRKLAYHPDSGNILVADGNNKRVQEVTPTGEAVRLIGAGVIDAAVCAIACKGPLVAVGKWDYGKNNGVMLFDYGSGALVRSFGDWGAGVGQLGYCRGMRFTADGRHIVVANGKYSWGGTRLSQWSVGGVFVKEVGRGALNWASDVALTGNGDWIVCDCSANEMVVLSGVDGSEVRRWGGRGDSDGKFKRPVALAQSASGELWVLDADSGRVQVFA